MTKWLTQQEKIHHFTAYLQWAVEGYHAEAIDVETEDIQDSHEKPLEDQGVHSMDIIPSGYSISKTPSYLNVPLTNVQKDFGAVDVLPCIDIYLRRLRQLVPYVTNPQSSCTSGSPLHLKHPNNQSRTPSLPLTLRLGPHAAMRPCPPLDLT
jgi:hypothetical protein